MYDISRLKVKLVCFAIIFLSHCTKPLSEWVNQVYVKINNVYKMGKTAYLLALNLHKTFT